MSDSVLGHAASNSAVTSSRLMKKIRGTSSITHSDFSPENLFVSGTVFLTDLQIGLEKSLEEQVAKYNSVSVARSNWIFFSELGHFYSCHNFAHSSIFPIIFPEDNATDNITLAEINRYGFDRRVFRLASRLSYSSYFNQSLLENLSELGICSVLEVLNCPDQSIQINTYCRCYDEWISIPGEDYYQIPPKCGENLIEELIHYILELTYLIFLFQKLTVEAIRLQYIANAIRNRISCSPTPYKKEPPIGGVKVGGEQHHNHRHVARTLYLRQYLSTMT